MMVAVFFTMCLALALGWRGHRALSLISIALCLGLCIWLFLFEVYSPENGFRMPWIDTLLNAPSPLTKRV